ncbi:AbiJ-NTD4 domain-containing protein [Pseudomonas nitroreducens]|uniref:AbiJ-NTD4 domain-containing protein n=1 Tax=Pseudomonas nitroreducens TaxID=46680 RepID=UPI001876C26C|nr:hypothetical protein [Pseudomonas nitritireducens]
MNMTFSERYGFTKARDVIQIDSMDEQLRVGLWNAITVCVFSGYSPYQSLSDFNNERYDLLVRRVWASYYHKTLDSRPDDWKAAVAAMRKDFFECDWFKVYNFLEFLFSNFKFSSSARESFRSSCNETLTINVSAYRVVDDRVVRITEGHEIDEIESAMSNAKGAESLHIRRALELLSDREAPDYRNSIKESISAVESLVQAALGEKGTLGALLNNLEERIELHAALKSAFTKLYGYTSDADGIRHALSDNSSIKFEDAKFMLVACSAFVNLVKVKLNP